MIREGLGLPGYIDGIDVSQVQRIDDPLAVAAAGFQWAIIKASEGATYCDPRAIEHLAALQGAGLLCGVYAFARVTGDPAQQVRRAIACGTDGFHSVIVCDLESAPADWTADRLTRWAEAFVDEVRALRGLCLRVNDGARQRLIDVVREMIIQDSIVVPFRKTT